VNGTGEVDFLLGTLIISGYLLTYVPFAFFSHPNTHACTHANVCTHTHTSTHTYTQAKPWRVLYKHLRTRSTQALSLCWSRGPSWSTPLWRRTWRRDTTVTYLSAGGGGREWWWKYTHPSMRTCGSGKQRCIRY